MQTVSKQQSLFEHNFLSKGHNHTDKSSEGLAWYVCFQKTPEWKTPKEQRLLDQEHWIFSKRKKGISGKSTSVSSRRGTIGNNIWLSMHPGIFGSTKIFRRYVHPSIRKSAHSS